MGLTGTGPGFVFSRYRFSGIYLLGNEEEPSLKLELLVGGSAALALPVPSHPGTFLGTELG